MTALWVTVLCGALSIVYAIWATGSVRRQTPETPTDEGNSAAAVREGAQALSEAPVTWT